MDVSVHMEGQGICRIECGQKMEWSARNELLEAAKQRIDLRQADGVVLDMRQVEFINSAGIGGVFSLRKWLREKDLPMVIAGPQPSVMRVFETVEMPRLIPILEDLEEARHKVRSVSLEQSDPDDARAEGSES